MPANEEIAVLTPLGAVFLTGVSTEAVRVATVQGHVRTRGVIPDRQASCPSDRPELSAEILEAGGQRSES